MIFSFANTTLLFILFANPLAKQGPATAEILASAIPFSFKMLSSFSAKVSNLFSIIVKPFVPAVFALPFFQFYSSVNLFDTHIAIALSHCLFNIPLAVWILEGFMSAVPKELDETAYVDGYSFPKFFFKIFIPTIAAGIGITMFFCFMFSWVELLLAKTLTATMAKPIAAIMTRTSSTSGYELGLLAAAGSLTIIPGAVVIYFVRNYIAKGFAMGRV